MTGTASIGGSAIGLTSISGGYLYLDIAGRSLDSNWAVRTSVTSLKDFHWTQRSAPSIDLDVQWMVQGSIIAASTLLRWAEMSLSTNTVVAPWSIKTFLDSEFLAPWGVRATEASELEATWRQFQAITDSSTLDWRVRLIETKGLGVPWSQRKKEGIELSVYWDIVGSVVATTASVLWANRQLQSNTVDLNYAIRRSLGDLLINRWGVLRRSSSETGIQWTVLSIEGDSVRVRWKVEGPRGREFIGTQVISLAKLTADARIAAIDPLITIFVVED